MVTVRVMITVCHGLPPIQHVSPSDVAVFPATCLNHVTPSDIACYHS